MILELYSPRELSTHEQINNRVLIPVDSTVMAPNIASASKGHAAVLLIEKINNGNNLKATLFETSGVSGGKYALNDIKSHCKATGKRPFLDDFTPEELNHLNNRIHFHKNPEVYLRFSRWTAEGMPVDKIKATDIKKVLGQVAVIREPLTVRSEFNKKVAALQQAQNKNIYSTLENFGPIRLNPQPLSFAQVGGECEYESLMNSCSCLVEASDKTLANNVRLAIHDMSFEFIEEQLEKSETEINTLQRRVESLDLRVAPKSGIQLANYPTRLLPSQNSHQALINKISAEKNKVLILQKAALDLEPVPKPEFFA